MWEQLIRSGLNLFGVVADYQTGAVGSDRIGAKLPCNS